LRPVKISDETMLKDFFYSLSDKSLYQRFLTIRRHMPHEELQKQFVVIDYTKEMIILAVKKYLGHEVITGVAQYCINGSALSAEASIVVRDDFQKMGIGFELLSYLVYVAQKQGLHLFQANVMPGNHAVLRLIEKLNLETREKVGWRHFLYQYFLDLDSLPPPGSSFCYSSLPTVKPSRMASVSLRGLTASPTR